MCLGVPGQIVSMVDGYGDQLAVVDLSGRRSRVNIGMLDNQSIEPGDWVIVHMGFAMETIDAPAAEETLAGLDVMEQLRKAMSESASVAPTPDQ